MPRRRSISATLESAVPGARTGRRSRRTVARAAEGGAAGASASPQKRRRRGRPPGSARKAGPDIPVPVVALSRALREARSNAGLTQRSAADRIGVHFVTLYTWESEQQPAQPNDKNLAKAARLYHTTPVAIRRRAAELEV